MKLPAAPSHTTKVVVFVAALVCTTFPNGGDDFILDVRHREIDLGVTLLNCVWISLVSIGLLWLLRQMSEYAQRGNWRLFLSLVGCFFAFVLSAGAFCGMLPNGIGGPPTLLFLLIWAGMAVRAAVEMIQARSTSHTPQEESREAATEGETQPDAPLSASDEANFVPPGFRPLHRLSTWLMRLLGIGSSLAVVGFLSGVFYSNTLDSIAKRTATVSRTEFCDLSFQLIGVIQASVFVTTAVLFGVWIVRAARNVRALGATGFRVSPGWAVGWYFVPFAFFYMPFVAMNEIWKASGSPEDWQELRTPIRLRLWWFLWLAPYFLATPIGHSIFSHRPSDMFLTAKEAYVAVEQRMSDVPSRMLSLQAEVSKSIIRDLFGLFLGLSSIWVVRSITRRQAGSLQNRSERDLVAVPGCE